MMKKLFALVVVLWVARAEAVPVPTGPYAGGPAGGGGTCSGCHCEDVVDVECRQPWWLVLPDCEQCRTYTVDGCTGERTNYEWVEICDTDL